MIDLAVDQDALRADVAREKLLKDIRKLKELGGNMVQKTETAIGKAPLAVGLGAAGVALIGLVVYASRRRPKPLFPRLAPERRSFFGEALRGAALAALSVVGQRVAQHVINNALGEPPEERAVAAAAE